MLIYFPDIIIHYQTVIVRTWTHATGGLTIHDFALAAEIDALTEREKNT